MYTYKIGFVVCYLELKDYDYSTLSRWGSEAEVCRHLQENSQAEVVEFDIMETPDGSVRIITFQLDNYELGKSVEDAYNDLIKQQRRREIECDSGS